MAGCEELKQAACQAIDMSKEELHELSKALWNNPELAWQEKYAHDYLADFLEKHGFEVERHYKGVETAFRATVGEGNPHVSVISEYDALPEIGHACGHNLIAEVGVASGIGIKAAMEAAGGKIGKLTVLGTPAEEDGGGKVNLVKAGAFKDIDFCGMCHPFPVTATEVSKLFLGVHRVVVTYKGKASHAAGYPWEGVNALDAAVMAFNNISCMRQQIKPNWRVHGVIKKGGTKSNIIPELTELEYSVRTPSSGELETLKAKVTSCFKAAALATGCELSMEWYKVAYKNILPYPKLAEIFQKNGESVGVEFCKESLTNPFGSTDMGNVSHEVPSIHPVFYIGGTAPNHTRGFTADAGSDTAQKYTLDQAKALAMTAIDILTQPELLSTIKKEFQEAKIADAKG